MIEKVLETLFRHKLLLLVPPILIPLIVAPATLLIFAPYYQTTATIWVDRPRYLKYNEETAYNLYQTPAQIELGRLTELLAARSFVMEVAGRTSLAPLVGSVTGEQEIWKIINGKSVRLISGGEHLVVLRFGAETPELSFQVVNALIDIYQEKATEERGDRASVAISLYESRLQALEDQLATSSGALRRYLAARPNLTDTNRGPMAKGVAPATVDPQVGELQRRVEADQKEVERARTAMEQARLDTAALQEGQQLGFDLLDRPELPTHRTRELSKMIVAALAAPLAGLGVSAMLLVVLVAGDRSARSETDLAPIVRVLGAIPELRLARVPKRAGSDATRRAIGFVAGAALPAPQGAK